MKKLFLSFGIMFIAVLGMNTVNAQIEKGAKIEFSKETHDYGNIKYGGEPYCNFEFKNTGDEPLIISNAKGSCGCTVPQWPKEEIAPGATGEIKVRYDTKRVGVINKSVTIQSNAMNADNVTRAKKDADGKVTGGTSVIRIKGEVKAPKANATPVKPAQGPVNSTE